MIGWLRSALLAGFVAGLALSGHAPASAAELTGTFLMGRDRDDIPLAARVPRMASAKAQLAHARRLKARTFRAKGEEERRFWRSLAVEGYQAIREYHPKQRAICAEGAFRAGEMLRADGEREAAQKEFGIAAKLGPGTPFRSRARLELGHLARQAGEARVALDHYLEVASDNKADPRHREEAWFWAGRTWWERGDQDQARRAWRGICERLEDPFAALRAYDELTLTWVEVGDLEAAAGQLMACRLGLISFLLEETERGEKLSNAFLRMRGRKALRLAIERKQ